VNDHINAARAKKTPLRAASVFRSACSRCSLGFVPLLGGTGIGTYLADGTGLRKPNKTPSILPGDADLQRIVDDRVATYHDSVGLIVAWSNHRRRLFARGPAQTGNDDSVDGMRFTRSDR